MANEMKEGKMEKRVADIKVGDVIQLATGQWTISKIEPVDTDNFKLVRLYSNKARITKRDGDIVEVLETKVPPRFQSMMDALLPEESQG